MASRFLRLARFSLLFPLVIFLFPLLIALGLATIFLANLRCVTPCSGKLPFRTVKSPRQATSKHRRTQTDASARKIARRNRGQRLYAGPVAASKATTRLPRNNEYFIIPSHQTYSGKDIRRAVFAAHMERAANAQRAQDQIRRYSSLKPFRNYDHRIPHPTTKPLSSMQGGGHEFPIGPHTDRQKGPARIVVRFTNGHTELLGVVARDLLLPVGSLGSSDDFEVTPTSVETFWELGETFISATSMPRRPGSLRDSFSYFIGG